MEQAEARRRAKKLRGIAIGAYQRPNGTWRYGGWPNQKGETWIVVSADKSRVLDDGSGDESAEEK